MCTCKLNFGKVDCEHGFAQSLEETAGNSQMILLSVTWTNDINDVFFTTTKASYDTIYKALEGGWWILHSKWGIFVLKQTSRGYKSCYLFTTFSQGNLPKPLK